MTTDAVQSDDGLARPATPVTGVPAKSAPDKPLRAKLLEFLQEDDGSFSATRLAFLLWVVGVLVVWVFESIRLNALQSLSGDVTTIIGILMTGKVVQKFGEKNPEPNQ